MVAPISPPIYASSTGFPEVPIWEAPVGVLVVSRQIFIGSARRDEDRSGGQGWPPGIFDKDLASPGRNPHAPNGGSVSAGRQGRSLWGIRRSGGHFEVHRRTSEAFAIPVALLPLSVATAPDARAISERSVLRRYYPSQSDLGLELGYRAPKIRAVNVGKAGAAALRI